MPSEVVTAMAEANEYMVDMFELQDAAGKRAAELLGAPAAMVTAGGFSSLILGAAACLTGNDPKKIEALPKPTWPRQECLMQKAHQFSYDRAFRAAGATVVYAEDWGEMASRIGEQTAMIAGITIAERQGVFAPPFNAKRGPPPRPNVIKSEQLVALEVLGLHGEGHDPVRRVVGEVLVRDLGELAVAHDHQLPLSLAHLSPRYKETARRPLPRGAPTRPGRERPLTPARGRAPGLRPPAPTCRPASGRW